ncbi:Peptidase T [Maioricimonas rarisocia]|uniref:Peptidase T n=1 Tax=Maioricimonas rarisocia TaxID=2528026 RepID=A0A517ZDM6_9PLAN|nr:M20/M25/M40 family metallo-hydrolase [Maioricimonas rarisocia]QDU40568.1 Peptidase T [Maioricimonas rarisocia]
MIDNLNGNFDRRAVDRVTKLMAIPGPSGREAAVAAHVTGLLKEAGVPDSAIRHDSAARRAGTGGEIGNLIVKLPGTVRGPRRLMMAHMDTVPLCEGAEPVRRGDWIHARSSDTALGGDNRAGVAVVLNSALTLLEQELPHPPLTLLFTVQEEVGLLGARHVTKGQLGKPELCFNWDGGAPNIAVIGATGDDHLDIEVQGLASHAGAHPEDGVSAIAIASRAIADLTDNGWHGLITKGRNTGTSNIGFVSGGAATNVVMNHVVLRAEARSHKPQFRRKIVNEFRKAFERAARNTTSADGQTGQVQISVRDKYEAFRMPKTSPCVKTALAAVAKAGMEPQTRIVNGGLDANWMYAHGLPTVTLGCGQAGIHTVEETLHIPSFLAACQVGVLVASATESSAD